VPASDPALFRTFPILRQSCPHHAFVSHPTPIEPLALGGAPTGRLFVKRDERSCPLYGGNKPRKLEFLLGAALARRARRLMTSGGLGTHHGLATAILGRELGLATTLVLVPQPITEAVRRSLRCHVAYGADLVYAGSVPAAAARGGAAFAASALRGERPFYIPPGGSSTAGSLGFVSAGLELGEQVRAGSIPEPSEIWLAVGTGGTLAGLVAGLRLAQLESRVVGVLVTDILPPSPAKLARAATGAVRRLRRLGAEIPPMRFTPADFDLVLDQVGPGYGATTPASCAAVAAAAHCGLVLEETYTGKALAALLARHQSDWSAGPVLFWNTYNGVDVASRAPRSPDAVELPRRIRRALERAPAAQPGPDGRPAK
jgi:D-cysteine desulfhydrase